MAKEINDVEGPVTVNEHVTQNWFRCFKEDDTNLEDKPGSKNPSIVEDETLLEMTEQQLSPHTLSTGLDPS